jgi:hypothetical protein
MIGEKSTWMENARAVLFPPAPDRERGVERSVYERFAIPYTFKPRLSFGEAVVAATGACLRIFLGSLLFAIWGTYSLEIWTAIRSYFWRTATLLPLFLLFVLSQAVLMLAISALVRTFSPKRP